MGTLPDPNPPERATMERREHGRLRTPDLRCNLGVVADMSAGGIKIVGRRRLEGEHVIQFADEGGRLIQVKGRVAWCRRLGFARFAIGFSFIDPDPETTRALTRLGMRHSP